DIDVGFDIRDRPADVGRNEIKDFFRFGRVASDPEVGSQHNNGDVNAAEQVAQVIVDEAEFRVAVLQLLVNRGQLFVGRLEFFLGGFQFFVGALEFFVAGLNFFVGAL